MSECVHPFSILVFNISRLDPISDRSDEGGASSSASGWGDVHSPTSLSRKTSPAKPKFGNDIGMHNTAIPIEVIPRARRNNLYKLEQILKLLSNQCKSFFQILKNYCKIVELIYQYSLVLCIIYIVILFIYLFIHAVSS